MFKVINQNNKELKTDVCLHPGEVLTNELSEREIKKSDFANLLGLRPSHFSELLHGRRRINAPLAIKIQSQLKISAEFWLRLQLNYDLFIERKKIKVSVNKKTESSL